MKNFEYSIPTKILFGKDQIENLGKEIKCYGNRILLVYGKGSIKKRGIYDKVVRILNSCDIGFVELPGIKPNPSIESVREGIILCRNNNIDFILGVGGGSVIDCMKVIAGGVNYEGDPWDLFVDDIEVNNALPIGSILTLAATGSEMNGNAVITNEETKQKLAIGHDLLKPRFSILDPTYTYSVSPYQTASGIADIMSHVIEQYFSNVEDTAIQDRLAEALLKVCIEFGPIALNEPENYNARANLMWASSIALNGLLSYGKNGDWATHQIEHKISALFDLTHGVGLAIITPHWMENVLSDETADKFVSYAVNVWNIPNNQDKMLVAKNGIEATANFFSKTLSISKTLSDEGICIKEETVQELADDILRFGAIGNFKKLDKEDICNILIASL